MKQLFLTLVFLFAFLGRVSAQELTVKSMEAAPMDLSASTSPRLDLNKQPCALVKVQLPLAGAAFSGNVLGEVENRAGVYWVYMSQGSYKLQVRHQDFMPLEVNFRDYGIRGVEGKVTYVLTLQKPQTPQALEEKKQMLIINYTPKDATVVIDSKLQKGNGRVEVELPLGEHSYMIVADGYITAEGTVKLNGGSQRVLNETLEKDVAVTTMQSDATSMQETVSTVVTPAAPAVEMFTVGGVSFRMVRVEGGTFNMGSNNTDEKPVHSVTLSSYSIGETEVTQALWSAVMGTNPSYHKGDNLPVEQVSWEDCQRFIRKLNTATGRTFRLPTEAEWEFAARGGTKSLGYVYSGSNDLDAVAWHSGLETHPVGTKLENELGLYDMTGNVVEWCQDWYGKYHRGSQTNPKGATSGSSRVFRGGGISIGPWHSTSHYGDAPTSRYYNVGLRLAF